MSVIEPDEIVSSQDSCATPMVRPPPSTRANRYDSPHFFSLPSPQKFLIMSVSVSAVTCFCTNLWMFDMLIILCTSSSI